MACGLMIAAAHPGGQAVDLGQMLGDGTLSSSIVSSQAVMTHGTACLYNVGQQLQ